MYKTIFNKRNSLKFNRFSNKNYSLFAVLGREVLVGALSVATLSHANSSPNTAYHLQRYKNNLKKRMFLSEKAF